jgi:hypothetical protein
VGYPSKSSQKIVSAQGSTAPPLPPVAPLVLVLALVLVLVLVLDEELSPPPPSPPVP